MFQPCRRSCKLQSTNAPFAAKSSYRTAGETLLLLSATAEEHTFHLYSRSYEFQFQIEAPTNTKLNCRIIWNTLSLGTSGVFFSCCKSMQRDKCQCPAFFCGGFLLSIHVYSCTYYLGILPSSSPIPHSRSSPFPNTCSLSFSHPLSFPSLPWPLCFTHFLLISPSGLSYMLNFSCPFYLKCKMFKFNLALKHFYTDF